VVLARRVTVVLARGVGVELARGVKVVLATVARCSSDTGCHYM